MSGKSNNNISVDYSKLEILIDKFCDVILIKGDCPDFEKGIEFVESLNNDEKSNLNLEEPEKDNKIRIMVQNRVVSYLKSFDYSSDATKIIRPFEFDSGGAYEEFCDKIQKAYKDSNQNAKLPSVLVFVCEYINETSEHYRIFGHFYDSRSLESSHKILSDMKIEANKAADEAVKKATEEAAKKAVDEALSSAMIDVNKNITKNSVTILGIFSGIVLTVVGGLFYSSAVLESVSATNLYKLICIAALVGIVCIDLLLIMFRYIDKIRTTEKDEQGSFLQGVKSNAWPIIVNILLIAIMIFSGVVYVRSLESSQDLNDAYDAKEATCDSVVLVIEATEMEK